MLNRRRDTLALNTADVADRGSGSKEGILAKILEVAAVHGRTVDVYAWSEQKDRASRTSVASQLTSKPLSEIGIP